MKNYRNKKRIFLIMVAVLCCHTVLCGFGITPDIAELKVTKPFIDLDLMVKDSVGTSGAEEIKTEETETVPAPTTSPGTDIKESDGEIRIEVWQDRIKLDGVWCSNFDDFTSKFDSKYNKGRRPTVYLVDNYADSKMYKDVLASFRKYEITPVREQIND